jgi:large subunit ribosomal protein L9
MKILLTDDVVGLGDIGETVKVKAGYARNFLIPNGLAYEVGATGAKEAQHRARQLEAKKNHLKVEAEALAERMSLKPLKLELRVGSGGKVFGSIATKDIAAALKASEFEIDRRRVQLNEPIKKIGEHVVKVKLHPEVYAEIKVVVKSLEATKEQEQAETGAAKRRLDELTAASDDDDISIPTEDDDLSDDEDSSDDEGEE